MKVVDPQRNITYPSLAHQAVADAIRRDTLAEELRILYVAMTRAKEHLVLVGTASPGTIGDALAAARRREPGVIDGLTLATATSPIDWILSAAPCLPAGSLRVCRPGETAAAAPGCLFTAFHHDPETMREWELPEERRLAKRAALSRIAELAPLSKDEPVGTEDAAIRDVIARLEFQYGPLAMTTVPARQTVTELKRQFDPFTESDERPPVSPPVDKGGRGSSNRRRPRAASRRTGFCNAWIWPPRRTKLRFRISLPRSSARAGCPPTPRNSSTCRRWPGSPRRASAGGSVPLRSRSGAR